MSAASDMRALDTFVGWLIRDIPSKVLPRAEFKLCIKYGRLYCSVTVETGCYEMWANSSHLWWYSTVSSREKNGDPYLAACCIRDIFGGD